VPFARPTPAEILARIQADYKGELPDADPYFPRSTIFAELAALTAAIHELNGRLEGVVRNHFADTADPDELERKGSLYGLTRGLPAYAVGTVTHNGLAGTAVPEGTIHVAANGNRYRSTSAAVVPGSGTVTCPVQAIEKGAVSNIPAASGIELEEPILGIASGTGFVGTGGITGGDDAQGVETFRAEVLAHMRRLPQGGTHSDLERWLFEALSPPFTRVFVGTPAAGSNLVGCFAVDDTLDVDGNAIARVAGDYTAALAYVFATDRKPLGLDVTLAAPAFVDLDMTITLTPNTAATQAAVLEEIIQLLIREADIATAPPESHFAREIAGAAGVTDHTIDTVIPTVSAGQLLRIGTTTFL
jgi:uncharacterized phage protein gp47/JayE